MPRVPDVEVSHCALSVESLGEGKACRYRSIPLVAFTTLLPSSYLSSSCAYVVITSLIITIKSN